MPSQLVNDVRQLIRARQEEGRPITAAERALLLATLAPPRHGGSDAIDDLEAAIMVGRTALADQHAEHRPAAIRRLLAAARGVLDHTYTTGPVHDERVLVGAGPARPYRADVDG